MEGGWASSWLLAPPSEITSQANTRSTAPDEVTSLFRNNAAINLSGLDSGSSESPGYNTGRIFIRELSGANVQPHAERGVPVSGGSASRKRFGSGGRPG